MCPAEVPNYCCIQTFCITGFEPTLDRLSQTTTSSERVQERQAGKHIILWSSKNKLAWTQVVGAFGFHSLSIFTDGLRILGHEPSRLSNRAMNHEPVVVNHEAGLHQLHLLFEHSRKVQHRSQSRIPLRHGPARLPTSESITQSTPLPLPLSHTSTPTPSRHHLTELAIPLWTQKFSSSRPPLPLKNLRTRTMPFSLTPADARLRGRGP